MTLAAGRWISPEDYQTKERVAMLGAKAAQKLFGEIPPEGETITINGLQFQMIGLLKTKTQISNYNTPDNECVFIPLSTASLLQRYQVSGRHRLDAGQSARSGKQA